MVNPHRHIPTPSYVGKVSCREFWQQFLRNRSRWGPDLVQIWSRFGPDFAVQTVWTNFGNHPVRVLKICTTVTEKSLAH